jgi:tetratricopeptide (TPR) repeat protein
MGVAVLLVLISTSGFVMPAALRAAQAGLSEASLKYFRELRRRGLFRLAESYCLERLSHSGLSPAERADLSLELSRTLAEHADVVADPEQTELYNRSQSTLTDFLNDEPENPRRLLLEVQRALLPASMGHARRMLVELQPFNATARQQAIETLNTAVENLRAAEGQIAQRLKKSSGARSNDNGEIRPFELKPLLAHVRLAVGEALLDVAQLHPAGSPECVASLIAAQKALKSVSESTDDGDVLWMSRVAFVACSRLLGDHERTLRELDTFEKRSPPPEIFDRLLAERVRVLIAQKKFRDATALFARLQREPQPLAGEFGLLQIELSIAEWQAGQPGRDQKVPAQLMQSLADRAVRLRRESGGYWGSRGDLLIGRLRDAQQYGAELADLVARAESAFHAGNSREAVDLYGDAAARANAEGRPELAFQFGFTRASIEIKSQSWVEAAADLLKLAEQFPKNSRAAAAHLLAAFALGKSYDEKPSRPRREEFTRILEEHRKKFDGDPTAVEATWMLAELDERRGQFTQALELYKSIPRDHQHGPAAQVAVARACEGILDRLRELKQPTDEWEEAAVKTLQKMLPAWGDGVSAWDIHQAEVAVRLARIMLNMSPPQFAAADRLLLRVGKSLDTPEPQTGSGWTGEAEKKLQAMARQLQIVSLAGQERFQEARTLLQQLSGADPAELLQILEGITPLQSDERRDPFHDLGMLQLDAALKLNEHRSKLSTADQRRLDECLARAYFATGEIRQGRQIYETLVQRNPRDKAAIKAYADLLVKCGNKECLNEAVSTWRKLESLHEPGSQEWYPVRYELCRSLLLAKQTTEAAKLLKMTRLLYPKPESESWQRKFVELEAECATVSREKSKR